MCSEMAENVDPDLVDFKPSKRAGNPIKKPLKRFKEASNDEEVL